MVFRSNGLRRKNACLGNRYHPVDCKVCIQLPSQPRQTCRSQRNHRHSVCRLRSQQILHTSQCINIPNVYINMYQWNRKTQLLLCRIQQSRMSIADRFKQDDMLTAIQDNSWSTDMLSLDSPPKMCWTTCFYIPTDMAYASHCAHEMLKRGRVWSLGCVARVCNDDVSEQYRKRSQYVRLQIKH